MAGIHYMVYDSQVNSTIIEWNKTDGNLYFTDGSSIKPNIMTNHPIYLDDLYEEMNLLSYFDPYDTLVRRPSYLRRI
jgi:penicillin V acylase-like amidase (Ntn superfamily)